MGGGEGERFCHESGSVSEGLHTPGSEVTREDGVGQGRASEGEDSCGACGEWSQGGAEQCTWVSYGDQESSSGLFPLI